MKTRQAIEKHINQFKRPDNFNPASWMVLKKWAVAIWKAHQKQQCWQYPVKVTCPEFYAMICDEQGKCIIRDRVLLKFEVNRWTKPWAKELIRTAVDLAKSEEREEALKQINLALAISSQSAEAWNNKAVIEHQLKRYKSAFESFDKALSIAPEVAKIYMNRALLYRDVNWDEKAHQDLNKALSLGGDRVFIQKQQARSLWNMDYKEAAARQLHDVLNAHHGDEKDWTLLGDWLVALNKISAAQEAYIKVLNMNPFYADALFGNAMLKAMKQPNSKAVKDELEMAHILGAKNARDVLEALNAQS